MQIKEVIGVSFSGSVESPPLEDVVVLVDSAGVALGVQRAFSARVRGAVAPRRQERGRTIAKMAQFVVHDINNLLAVIGGGLRLLEGQSDSVDER